MKRKFFTIALSLTAAITCAIGLSACDDKATSSDGYHEAYQLYVDYANKQGVTAQPFEEWKATIRGEQGEQGEQGAEGEKGPMGDQGEAGEKGAEGEKGETGEKGATGTDGETVKSCYYDENGYFVVEYVSGKKSSFRHEHTYGDPQAIISASCENMSVKKQECTQCHYVMYLFSAQGEHSFDVVLEEQAATCTEGGYIQYVCSLCGEEKTELLQALGHDYQVDEEKSVAATCVADGVTYYGCTRCDDSYTTPITKLGHDYQVDEEKSVAATCVADGYTYYGCTRCDDFSTTPITKLGHDYQVDEAKSVAPTCTQDGEINYVCSRGDDAYSEVVEKLGHDWEILNSTATCTESGTESKKCKVCGEEVTENVVARGHLWDLGVNQDNGLSIVSMNSDGTVTYTCSVCQTTMTGVYGYTTYREILMGGPVTKEISIPQNGRAYLYFAYNWRDMSYKDMTISVTGDIQKLMAYKDARPAMPDYNPPLAAEAGSLLEMKNGFVEKYTYRGEQFFAFETNDGSAANITVTLSEWVAAEELTTIGAGTYTETIKDFNGVRKYFKAPADGKYTFTLSQSENATVSGTVNGIVFGYIDDVTFVEQVELNLPKDWVVPMSFYVDNYVSSVSTKFSIAKSGEFDSSVSKENPAKLSLGVNTIYIEQDKRPGSDGLRVTLSFTAEHDGWYDFSIDAENAEFYGDNYVTKTKDGFEMKAGETVTWTFKANEDRYGAIIQFKIEEA